MLTQKHLKWSEIHLDTMRGLAALIVAFGHARGLFFSSFSNATSAVVEQSHSALPVSPLTFGHEAVMVFFVLSGYLVGGGVLRSFAADQWRWSDYLINRLVRLWIVLVPAILIGTLIDTIGFEFLAHTGGIYSAPPGQEYVLPEYSEHFFDIKTIVGNLLFLQGIFVPTSGTNVSLWSLSNEFWYYLMFPMSLVVFQRNATVVRRISSGLVVVGIAALIGVHADYLFLVWLLGAVVAVLPNRIPSRLAGSVVLGGALIFGIMFLMLKKFGLSLHVSEILLGGSTALLVYAVKCQDSYAETTFYSRVSRFFSDISYTLYLTHLPFLILICSIVDSPWKLWAASPVTLAEFVMVSSLAIVWAWILYSLFESKTDAVRRLVRVRFARFSGQGVIRAAGKSSPTCLKLPE